MTEPVPVEQLLMLAAFEGLSFLDHRRQDLRFAWPAQADAGCQQHPEVSDTRQAEAIPLFQTLEGVVIRIGGLMAGGRRLEFAAADSVGVLSRAT